MFLKCFGGPLDGSEAPFQDGTAFPWPCGWYYLVLKGEEFTFVWRDQPGTFIDKDREWLRDHGIPV
jgi:hypothetical protein